MNAPIGKRSQISTEDENPLTENTGIQRQKSKIRPSNTKWKGLWSRPNAVHMNIREDWAASEALQETS